MREKTGKGIVRGSSYGTRCGCEAVGVVMKVKVRTTSLSNEDIAALIAGRCEFDTTRQIANARATSRPSLCTLLLKSHIYERLL